jgi:hypothetical protein
VECYGLSGDVVFLEVGRNPYHLSTDVMTLASVAILS